MNNFWQKVFEAKNFKSRTELAQTAQITNPSFFRQENKVLNRALKNTLGLDLNDFLEWALEKKIRPAKNTHSTALGIFSENVDSEERYFQTANLNSWLLLSDKEKDIFDILERRKSIEEVIFFFDTSADAILNFRHDLSEDIQGLGFPVSISIRNQKTFML